MKYVRVLLVFCMTFAVWISEGFCSALPKDAPINSMVIERFDAADALAMSRFSVIPSEEDGGCRMRISDVRFRGDSGYALRIDYDLHESLSKRCGISISTKDMDFSAFDGFVFYAWAQIEKDEAPLAFDILFLGKDSEIASVHIDNLRARWTPVAVPFGTIEEITDWKKIKSVDIVFDQHNIKQKQGTIFIDDIYLSPGCDMENVQLKKSDLVLGESHIQIMMDNLMGFAKFDGEKAELPSNDREMLHRVARDTWGYFRDIIDRNHYLPLNQIQMLPDVRIGDYVSTTDLGLYYVCVVSAYDFGFISREEAVERIVKAMDTVDTLERQHGFMYNYYDTTMLNPTSNFLSFVDSGWLSIGMVIVRQAFPEELGQRCTDFLNSRDFSFFYDKPYGLMKHGYFVDKERFADYHYGAFYTEARAISLMAIGKGDVPVEHWFKIYRTMPSDWTWQRQAPQGVYRDNHGVRTFQGYYMFRNIEIVPSWGGSVFEGLMPAMVIDEKRHARHNLGLNNERYLKAQMLFCLEDMGYPVWGMSPCSVPGGGYSEYGVPDLGMAGKSYGQGVITPHATFLALDYYPKETIQNIRNLVKYYPLIYGPYGFFDAVSMDDGYISSRYLALDQAMILISLNNYLNNRAIQKRFEDDPVGRKAIPILKEERFFLKK